MQKNTTVKGIPQGWIIAGGVALLALALGNVALNTSNVEHLRALSAHLMHSHEVESSLQRVLSTVKDAETGQRGYVITGREDYLQPYEDARARLPAQLDAVAALVAADPKQRDALGELRSHLKLKMDELDETVRARRERGPEAATAVVRSDLGKREMDRMREIVSAMVERENASLTAQREQARVGYHQALASNLAAGAIGCAVIVAFMLLLHRFVRARERASRTIAEGRELLQTTLASIGDGVITTDREARVTFLNAVAESLTGWKAAEARGEPLARIFRIVNEANRNEVANPALRALEEGVIVGLANHTVLIARDGTERPIDDSAAPIRDADGAVVGCVLVFRDVTERTLIDAELRDADRRKDEFLATLAHELRNPLAPISNALFILAQGNAPPETAGPALAAMQRQVRQMVRLIDDLLDVSRIRLGKLALDRRRVELERVIEQAVETASPAIRSSSHELELALAPGPIYLDGDAVRLAQLFSNLLTNAAKFTPRGGHLRLAGGIEGERAVVRVKDDGIGLEEHQLERIFGLFSQIDQSLERTQSGLGIGLSLVRRIAELHGGTVEARSAGLGHGAEFVVRLPLATDQDAPAESTAVAPPVVVAPQRILIVDDNRDGADGLATMARLMGHEVRAIYDPGKAVAVASEMRPALAFLDIGMPGMNGYDLCRALRATSGGRSLRIVALTGWGQEQDRRRAEAAGFDEYFVKPIAPAQLQALCAQLASR